LIRRVSLGKDLRHALDRNEFVLYYQPIVSIDTGLLVGAEALLRWYRAGAELIPSEEFIPLAEETGVISEIGKRVLFQVCSQARQ
jgi:diguanylate cyclase